MRHRVQKRVVTILTTVLVAGGCFIVAKPVFGFDDMRAQNIAPADGLVTQNPSTALHQLSLRFDGQIANMGNTATLPVSTSQLEIDWHRDNLGYDRSVSTGAVPAIPYGGAPYPITSTLNETFPIGVHRYRFNADLLNEFPEVDDDNAAAWSTFTVRPSSPISYYDWHSDNSVRLTGYFGYGATGGELQFDNQSNNNVVTCPTLQDGWYCPGTDDIRQSFSGTLNCLPKSGLSCPTDEQTVLNSNNGPAIIVDTDPLNLLSASYVFRIRGYNPVDGGLYNNWLSYTLDMVHAQVTTLPATNITDTSMVLNGSINPMGRQSTGYFFYGTNPSATCPQTSNSNLTVFDGFYAGPFADYFWSSGERTFRSTLSDLTLTGLTPETTYYYCIFSRRSGLDSARTYGTVLSATTRETAPTVTLTANPTTINLGESFTLSWDVTDADACPVFGGDGFVDPGIPPAPFDDSQVITPTTAGDNKTYSLECSNDGGTTRDSVEVDVIAPVNPTVTLTANPTTINLGESFTLSWDVNDADECTEFFGDGFVDPGIPPAPFDGSQVITPTTEGSQAYSLGCSNAGGTTSDDAYVNVIAPENPTIESSDRVVRSSDPNPNVTLNYDIGSSDPTSCSVTGPGGYNSGWLTLPSGTLWTHMTARSTFRIDCGGTLTDSVTVDIVPLGWEN